MNNGMEERLLACIKEGRMPHSLLFSGQTGAGQELLARRGAALYCLLDDAIEGLRNCPNYGELDGRTAGVQQVRELMAATAVQSFNGGRRSFVILYAHAMNDQCQNVLLKTLEEPPENTLLILTGSEPGILPTIRSRCAVFRLGIGDCGDIAARLTAEGAAEDAAQQAALLSGGILDAARALLDPEKLTFRQAGADCLKAALSGGAPFNEAGGLITGMVTDLKTGERKRKADTALVQALLELWAGIARDGLAFHAGGHVPPLQPDCEKTARWMALRFTMGQIQGIIEVLASGLKRLAMQASPQMTVDTALSKLMLIGGEMKENI